MAGRKAKPKDCGPECPECCSRNVAGLMAAFWVTIDEDGALVGQFSDYSDDTEIGPERMCRTCGHEFEAE